MVGIIKIGEKQKLRLENITLKHVLKYMLDNVVNKKQIIHEVKKTHHQLIKRKASNGKEDTPTDLNAEHTYYSVGDLLRQYGYFQNGLPDFSEESEPKGTTIERPYHKIRKAWLRNLSIRLSSVYKTKYKELPPIGYGKVSENKPINSRGNLYTMEPEYKKVIDDYMKEHPEEKWFLTDELADERDERKLAKSKESKKKNKERVELYLEVKEYLIRRIKKTKKIDDKDREQVLKEYYGIIEKCKKELLKNIDMNVLFSNFKSKYSI